MAEYKDREAYIPYRRADVVELCIEDGKLSAPDAKKFREFCEIVAAYYHFDFHKSLENLKNNFAHLNPDADTKARVVPSAQECKERDIKLLEQFEEVLQRANYKRLTPEEWEMATTQESLIKLHMHVDFNDFERWVCYHRGDGQSTVQIKKLFKTTDFTMDTFERVVLLLQYKDEAYFKAKKRKDLAFTPGKTYIYMYKKIPKADLEVLFPNVQISMGMKDKLMLWLPAAGAGIGLLMKLIPTLVVVGSLIAAFIFGKKAIDDQNMLQGVIAALSLLVALGGFAFKQYIGYKNKKLKFLKDVTDTLFFRCLDCNAGVFNALIDSAEEEECKEVVLAFYHLLTSPKPLNEEQLDNLIEGWLENKFNTKIDFAVSKALHKLADLKGKLDESGPEVALLSKDANGVCKVLSIDNAKTVIDYTWDNIFQYNE